MEPAGMGEIAEELKIDSTQTLGDDQPSDREQGLD